MTRRRTSLVLSADTGVDDALAVLFAARSPLVALRAVGCVSGNVPVRQAVANTLRVLDAAGAAGVPVAAGSERPLLAPPPPPRRGDRHGRDGLADLGVPASPRRPVDQHALELLRTTIASAAPPVALAALGPLTDVALLVRTYPREVERLDRIVVLGGGERGEFNLATDPEAARIVLGSGPRVLRIGVEVARRVVVEEPAVEALQAAPDPAAALAGRLLAYRRETRGSASLGDAVGVLALLAPDGLSTELRDGVEVVVDVAAAAYARLFVAALSVPALQPRVVAEGS